MGRYLTCERCLCRVFLTDSELRQKPLRIRCGEHGGVLYRRAEDPKIGARPKLGPPSSTPRAKPKRPRLTPDDPGYAPGVTVTAVHPERRVPLTIHRPGETTTALASVCETLDRLGSDWRIVSVSTPATILRDLNGSIADTCPPEFELLASVGRLDLLEPTA